MGLSVWLFAKTCFMDPGGCNARAGPMIGVVGVLGFWRVCKFGDGCLQRHDQGGPYLQGPSFRFLQQPYLQQQQHVMLAVAGSSRRPGVWAAGSLPARPLFPASALPAAAASAMSAAAISSSSRSGVCAAGPLPARLFVPAAAVSLMLAVAGSSSRAGVCAAGSLPARPLIPAPEAAAAASLMPAATSNSSSKTRCVLVGFTCNVPSSYIASSAAAAAAAAAAPAISRLQLLATAATGQMRVLLGPYPQVPSSCSRLIYSSSTNGHACSCQQQQQVKGVVCWALTRKAFRSCSSSKSEACSRQQQKLNQSCGHGGSLPARLHLPVAAAAACLAPAAMSNSSCRPEVCFGKSLPARPHLPAAALPAAAAAAIGSGRITQQLSSLLNRIAAAAAAVAIQSWRKACSQ